MSDTDIKALSRKIDDLSLKMESLKDEVVFGQKQIFSTDETAWQGDRCRGVLQQAKCRDAAPACGGGENETKKREKLLTIKF